MDKNKTSSVIDAVPDNVVRCYFDANATSEYGDSPKYARLDVTLEFVARILSLAALCSSNELCSVLVYEAPDMWGPQGIEDDLHLRCAQLSVSRHSFWFVDSPKNTSYEIQSNLVDISDFLRRFEAAVPGDVLYFASDVPSLKNFLAEEADKAAQFVVEENAED
jgi:hypothetical protein